MTDSTVYVCAPRRRLFATLIGTAAAIVAALSLASPAGAVTLGSTHVAQRSQSAFFCGGFPTCAYAQTALQDGTVRAPFDGTIRSWRVNEEDAGSVQLLVLRKQSGGSFKAVHASSPKTSTTDGVNTFGANLDAHKGDFIGLNLLDENVFIQTLNPRPDRSVGFMPAFGLGAMQQPYAPFGSTFDELQFNAQLKH